MSAKNDFEDFVQDLLSFDLLLRRRIRTRGFLFARSRVCLCCSSFYLTITQCSCQCLKGVCVASHYCRSFVDGVCGADLCRVTCGSLDVCQLLFVGFVPRLTRRSHSQVLLEEAFYIITGAFHNVDCWSCSRTSLQSWAISLWVGSNTTKLPVTPCFRTDMIGLANSVT